MLKGKRRATGLMKRNLVSYVAVVVKSLEKVVLQARAATMVRSNSRLAVSDGWADR